MPITNAGEGILKSPRLKLDMPDLTVMKKPTPKVYVTMASGEGQFGLHNTDSTHDLHANEPK